MKVSDIPRYVTRRTAAALRATPLEGPARVMRSAWWGLSGRLPQSERYDRQTAAVVRKVATPSANFVDIGAHRGALLEVMVDAAPLGRHVAFEPLPGYAERLRSTFPDVDVRAIALADAVGELAFTHVVDAPAYSGLRNRPDALAGLTSTTITVAVSRLDDELDPELPVTLIKLDVEGAELEVLRGGIGTLRRWRPYVVFEHGRGGADVYGARPEMMFDLLESAGLFVSTLASWLDDGPPLTRDAFIAAFAAGREYVFLAHP